MKRLGFLLALAATGAFGQQTTSKPGTAAPYVINVQGNPSGTPIPISGSISTTGAADTVGATVAFNGNSVCAFVATAGQAGAGFFLAAGTLAATLTPSVSNDSTNGTNGNWTATKFVDISGNTTATQAFTNPNTFAAFGLQLEAGVRYARVCTTSFASGTASGNLIASTPQPPPPAAGADVTDRAGRLLGVISAGSNVIGHVIADTGSTTAVTGNVTAVQPTGTNLHVVADTGSTTAVTQATGTNLHAVIDTGSTTAVTQATGTNLHAVIDSGSTTAVTQATGTNLHTVVDSGAITVSGTVTTSPPANASTNIAQINGVTPLMGNGITGTGSPRVTIASDNTAFSVNAAATQSGTWTVQPGNTANTTAWKVDGSAVTQPVSGTVTANVGTTNGIALDASVTGLEVAQASTTSGQKGALVQGAVTNATPAFTTAQTDPLSISAATAGLRTDPATTFQVSPANQGLNAVTTATAGSTIDLTSEIANGVLAGPRGVNTHKCVLTMGGTSVSAAAVVIQYSHDGGTTWTGIPGSWAAVASAKTGVYEAGGNGWYPKVRCNLLTFTGSSPTATITYFGWNGKQDPHPLSMFRCQTSNNTATISTNASTDSGAPLTTSSCGAHAALASIAMTVTSITMSASVAATTTASQQLTVQYGTGSTCTSPVVIWSAFNPGPGGANSPRWAPGEQITTNGAGICFLDAATGNKSVTVTGYYGPWNG